MDKLKLIETNLEQQNTKGFDEEHKSMSCAELNKKARESFSYAMNRLYKDQDLELIGRYHMTIDEQQPRSEDFNKQLDKKLKESQEVFSSITVASYKDLGRYNPIH